MVLKVGSSLRIVAVNDFGGSRFHSVGGLFLDFVQISNLNSKVKRLTEKNLHVHVLFGEIFKPVSRSFRRRCRSSSLRVVDQLTMP
jgi:hypothetical protein